MPRALAVLLLIAASSSPAQDLRLDYTRESLTTTVRHYTQYVDGVPVLGGEMIERVERDGSVHEIVRTLVRDSPRRSSAERAVEGGVSGEPAFVNVGGELRSATRRVVEERLHERVAEYLDASTGEVLARVPLFFRAQGRVFDPSPVAKLNAPELRDHDDSASAVPDAAYSLVDLPDLAASGMLAGPNVQIVGDPSRPHADSAQSLLFDRSQPQFEEVNAYFLLDRTQRYLQSLGYAGARRVVAYPIPADPHALEGADNSLYASGVIAGRGALFYGDGGTDDAEDSDIVLHEYTHAIQDWIAPGAFFGTFASEARALAEGIADYWAFSSNYGSSVTSGRDPFCLAEWDARCAGDDSSQQCGYPEGADCLRRVDSTKTMSDFRAIDVEGQEHLNGEIWSSALRTIFQGLLARYGSDAGRRLADQLVIESMFGVPSNPTYAVLGSNLLFADNALNHAADQDIICSAMVARGILPGGCDRTPKGDWTLRQSPQQGVAIPDDSAVGVTSSLMIDDTRTIESLAVHVDVAHPSRGELQVILTAPDGTQVFLQNTSLDRTASAQVTYGIDAVPAASLDLFRGRSANGRWTLTVRDLVPGNRGTLRSWALLIRFAGDRPFAVRPFSFGPRLHIAAVAHASGLNDTNFVSDVRLFNRGTRTANAMVIYTPGGPDGAARFAAIGVAIAPKQILALNDVVAVTMQSRGEGSLEIQGEVADLIVTSRTYTADERGSFGQFIASAPTSAATAAATYVPHLRADSAFRSNVGLVEVAGASGVVRMHVYDAAGGVDYPDFVVTPFGQGQTPVHGAGDFMVEFRVVAGDARLLSYGSRIDNQSGDAIYVPGRLAPAEARTEYAPAIEAGGLAGTHWSSEVCFAQVVTAAPAFAVTFTEPGGSVLTSTADSPGPLISHCTGNVVDSVFGRRQTTGLLRADFPAGVFGTSRISTPSDRGTYGQYVPFLGAGEAVQSGDLVQLEVSDAFRTNIGAANIGPVASAVRFTAFDNGGVEIGRTERTLAPSQLLQISLASFAASATNARVHVDVLAGPGVLAYASVVDNRSGDAIYVPAQ